MGRPHNDMVLIYHAQNGCYLLILQSIRYHPQRETAYRRTMSPLYIRGVCLHLAAELQFKRFRFITTRCFIKLFKLQSNLIRFDKDLVAFFRHASECIHRMHSGVTTWLLKNLQYLKKENLFIQQQTRCSINTNEKLAQTNSKTYYQHAYAKRIGTSPETLYLILL